MVRRVLADETVISDSWVDAAPFRAQLRHLMGASGLSSAEVAVLAGISPGLAHRLLHGRGGRALRRVNPETARKLLRVTPGDARAIKRRLVPAELCRQHLRRLQAADWGRADLALLLGVTPDELAGLLDGRREFCRQYVALRAAVEVSLLVTALPLAPRRAAA